MILMSQYVRSGRIGMCSRFRAKSKSYCLIFIDVANAEMQKSVLNEASRSRAGHEPSWLDLLLLLGSLLYDFGYIEGV